MTTSEVAAVGTGASALLALLGGAVRWAWRQFAGELNAIRKADEVRMERILLAHESVAVAQQRALEAIRDAVVESRTLLRSQTAQADGERPGPNGQMRG